MYDENYRCGKASISMNITPFCDFRRLALQLSLALRLPLTVRLSLLANTAVVVDTVVIETIGNIVSGTHVMGEEKVVAITVTAIVTPAARGY